MPDSSTTVRIGEQHGTLKADCVGTRRAVISSYCQWIYWKQRVHTKTPPKYS